MKNIFFINQIITQVATVVKKIFFRVCSNTPLNTDNVFQSGNCLGGEIEETEVLVEEK